jgi:hypothetical protein
MTRFSRKAAMVCLAALAFAPHDPAQAADSPLTGTWTLVQADVLYPDGTRAHDYGEAPKGVFIIDAQGRYSLQIFDSSRPKYASADKKKGTPEEYKANAIGISTHFGRIDVDGMAHVMTLHVDGASFPNQEGSTQKRFYELNGDELSYRVEPRKDGSIPISVWRRLD